jgi:hypothetical protein
VAGRLEQHEPRDLALRHLLQQAVDELVVVRWLQDQQPPR